MKRIAMYLLVGTLALTGCTVLPQEAEETTVTVSAPVVTQRETFTVKLGPIDSRLSINASFGAVRQSSLYFRSSGRLKALYAKVGDQVQEGQLLAEQENSSLPYDLATAEIDLKRKELILSTAVAKKGFVDGPSAVDLEKYQMDVDQSKASLDYKREQLANTRIHAPFSGRIVSVSYAAGDTADSYKEVLVLAASGTIVARSTVDDSVAAQLQVGQAADIFPNDGDPTAVKGKVTVVPLAGTLKADKVVVVEPAQASSRVQVGKNGKVEVILQHKDSVVLVPLSAIRSFGGRQFVTVVKGETRQEISIKTGVASDSYAEVLEGLQAGDRVVSR